MELEALQQFLGEFRAAGAQLFALCPQRPEHSRGMVETLGLDYPILFDEDNRAATAFGLTFQTPDSVREIEIELGLDLPKHNGTDHWDLPMPARIVIDRAGIIRSCEVQADHALRTDPAATLAVLRSL